ncbi:Eukaryotic translation initiation factor 3 110 kDa subunit [Tenacibaculum sp. 190524A02b]|uniref:hypothetical protein n=1 Tax=Tenacibaculum vairaonense TaxID=3137860 RepID=UPI0032B17EC7
METNQLVTIEDINVGSLLELQGWREKQEEIVKKNPFITITDNKTYKEAKKRRTSLVSGRTEIQNQDKLIASKIKNFRSKVSLVSKELIAITLPHEEKQQQEVKKYEELKAKEKAEKERLEKERIEKIKNSIQEIYKEKSLIISQLRFEDLKSCKILENLNQIDTSFFEEFELDFVEKVKVLTGLYFDKKEQLEIREKQRLENEKFRKEREEFEAKQKEEEERLQKERERINAENNKRAAELEKKEAAIEQERKRIAKIESDIKAKEEKERKVKQEAKRKEEEEIKRKKIEEDRLRRSEALKPDIEKISKFIESLKFTTEIPKLKDEGLNLWLNETIVSFDCYKESMKEALLKIN